MGTKKNKKKILPGVGVGEQTSHDDSVPVHQHRREQTIRHAGRGRTEPRRSKTPPNTRRSRSPKS